MRAGSCCFVVVCLLLGLWASCDAQEMDTVTLVPSPTMAFLRHLPGCDGLSSYPTVKDFVFTELRKYEITHVREEGIDKPFFELRYGVPGAPGYKQSAIVLHHTKYTTLESIITMLAAFGVREHPVLAEMDAMYKAAKKEMNVNNRKVRNTGSKIAIIQRENDLTYAEVDAVIDDMHRRKLLKKNSLGINLHSEAGDGSDESFLRDHTDSPATSIDPEVIIQLEESLLEQEGYQNRADELQQMLMPWLTALNIDNAQERIRAVRYKLRLVEKEKTRAERLAKGDSKDDIDADDAAADAALLAKEEEEAAALVAAVAKAEAALLASTTAAAASAAEGDCGGDDGGECRPPHDEL